MLALTKSLSSLLQTSIFSSSYYKNHPEPILKLTHLLHPSLFQPGKSHEFIKFLYEKRILLRCYCENIDDLVKEAGVPHDKIVLLYVKID